MSYVVKNFEPGLWTVGFYQPDGKFDPEGDYTDQVAAGQRCHFLNGGTYPAVMEERGRLAKQLADLRTSLDYCAGQWESNAMPHTHPVRSGEYRSVMAACARDLRYALKANAPDAPDLRAVITEMLDHFWPGERFEGISEGLAEAQKLIDGWRERAGLERQS